MTTPVRSEEISELCMCAVRYALSRDTSVAFSVPRAVMAHKDQLTNYAIAVMLRDVSFWMVLNHPDANTWPSWLKFKRELTDLHIERQKERHASQQET